MRKRGAHRRTALSALALAALGLALSTGTASAHKAGAGSYLEFSPYAISETAVVHSGMVNSAARFCRAGRVVELYLAGVRLASVRSAGSGHWSLTGARPPQGSLVTARVKPKVKRKGRHRHRCGGDQISKKVR